MNFSVYILYSKKLDRFYVGFTSNLENRIKQHNKGESSYTSQGIPWIILWATSKEVREEAEHLERKLKNLSRVRKIDFMNKYSEGIINYKLLTLPAAGQHGWPQGSSGSCADKGLK